jgi:ACR3 family arsenite efflux pump ArsB
VPTLYLLLDLSDVHIPYVTIVVSVSGLHATFASSSMSNARLLHAAQVIIFVLVPFVLGSLTRWWLMRGRTPAEGERRISRVEDFFAPITMIGECSMAGFIGSYVMASAIARTQACWRQWC